MVNTDGGKTGGPTTRKQSTRETVVSTEIFNLENPSNKDLLIAISSIHKSNENTNKKLDTVMGDIKNLIIDNESNINQIEQNKTVLNLVQLEMTQLQNELEYTKQKEYNNDVIISGIPYIANITAEDIINSTKQIYMLKNEDIISFYTRQLENQQQIQLFIKFRDLGCKDIFIKKVRTSGPLFANQLLPQSCNQAMNVNRKIFINDRLTKYYINILRQLRQLQIQKHLSNIWFRNGSFFVKINKNDTTSTVVCNMMDIDKLISRK